MNYDKSIFDYRDLPVNVRADLGFDARKCDIFRDKICQLFAMAKDYNMNELSINQVTVAYYRTYTAKDKKDVKTLQQIRTKLYTMAREDSLYKQKYPNSDVKILKRIPNEGIYFFE